MKRHYGVVAILSITCLTLSGCSIIQGGPSAEELVALGCKETLSAEGLDYFRQAADLNSDYRKLALSVSALQNNKRFIESGNLDGNGKRALAFKMIDDLAVVNAYCQVGSKSTDMPSPTQSATPTPSKPAAVKYKNCTEAKAAGVTPIRKTTDPALYSLNTALDGDKDGDACES